MATIGAGPRSCRAVWAEVGRSSGSICWHSTSNELYNTNSIEAEERESWGTYKVPATLPTKWRYVAIYSYSRSSVYFRIAQFKVYGTISQALNLYYFRLWKQRSENFTYIASYILLLLLFALWCIHTYIYTYTPRDKWQPVPKAYN